MKASLELYSSTSGGALATPGGEEEEWREEVGRGEASSLPLWRGLVSRVELPQSLELVRG